MDYSNLIEYFLLGTGGSISMEIINIYQLRSKFHLKKYQNMFKNPSFWIITIATIFASGFLAWVINVSSVNPTISQIVTSGVGATSVLKNLYSSHFIKNNSLQ